VLGHWYVLSKYAQEEELHLVRSERMGRVLTDTTA